MAGPPTQICEKKLRARMRIDATLDDFAVGNRLSIRRFVTGVIGCLYAEDRCHCEDENET
jgi:hypothetical protein